MIRQPFAVRRNDSELHIMMEISRSLAATTRRINVIGRRAEMFGGIVLAHLPCAVVRVGGEATGPTFPFGPMDLDQRILAESPPELLVLLEDCFDQESSGELTTSQILDDLVKSNARPDSVVAIVRASGFFRPADGESVVGNPSTELLQSRQSVFTRRQICSEFEGAGLRIANIRSVRDDGVLQPPAPLDGSSTRVRTVDGREIEITATDIDDLYSQRYVLHAMIPKDSDHSLVCTVVLAVNDVEWASRWLLANREWLGNEHYDVVGVGGGTKALEEIGAANEIVVRAVETVGERSLSARWNAGARSTSATYIALLTDDLSAAPNWLSDQINVLGARNELAAVSGQILSSTGERCPNAYDFVPVLPFHCGPRMRTFPINEHESTTGVVVPCAALRTSGTLVRRGAFAQVGGFDEDFDGWLGEVDLSLRLRAHSWQLGVTVGAALTMRDRAEPSDLFCDSTSTSDQRDWIQFTNRWQESIPVPIDEETSTPRALSKHQGELGRTTPIVWSGSFLDASGYASECRSLLTGLEEAGIDILSNPIGFRLAMSSVAGPARRRLESRIVHQLPDQFVHVTHSAPSFRTDDWSMNVFSRHPSAVLNIGRTMFETDQIPWDWVGLCNSMDEVWVPSTFNLRTFADAGVRQSKLHYIASPLDVEIFDPTVEPLDLGAADTYCFLSVFGWGLRKGWDLLVRAFVDEFDRGEARLFIKTMANHLGSVSEHRGRVDYLLRETLHRDPQKCAEISFIDLELEAPMMSRLYRSVDAFVMPSRGEGWGRPYMEAMAMELPTIGTRWSGNLDFMNDENSYLVDAALVPVSDEAGREIPLYRGHRWAEPDLDQLKAAMRSVIVDPVAASNRGRRARLEVTAKFNRSAVTASVVERLNEAGIAPVRHHRPPRRPLVAWEGPQLTDFGMAVANRELCSRLVRSVSLDLVVDVESVAGFGAAYDTKWDSLVGAARNSSDRPEITVRHFWPPNFNRPASGRLVLYQPWEFGSLPLEWIEPLNTVVDEVWVPSSWVRDCYLRSGVNPERVVVMNLGVDTERFHPGTAPHLLDVEQSFKFLYVGGTLGRKGSDTLLSTYLSTFGPGDDVCLVVKDFGTSTFYRDQGIGELFQRAQDDPTLAPVRYFSGDLAPATLADLYRACDVLVHPYRGEGFGLPIAEAMASGLAVIVPQYGPTLDLCTPDTAFFVPAIEMHGQSRFFGEIPTVDPPWWAEVDARQLASTMLAVRAAPDEASVRGRRAAARMREHFTWEAAASRIETRLMELCSSVEPVRSAVTPKHQELSVCMIVKNGEVLIGRALASVAAISNELIVLDTGSTDRTVEIALEHGAQVLHFPWSDDFAAARNEAMKAASKEWILMLDADQEIDPTSFDELRRLIQTRPNTGYILRQMNYAEAEGDAIIAEHGVVRLFPNHASIQYVGAVHEQVVSLDANVALTLSPCNVIVHHEGFRPQHRDEQAIAQRDLIALLAIASKDPTSAFTAFNLGQSYRLLKRYEESANWYAKSIDLATRPDAPESLALWVGGAPGRVLPSYVLSARIELARVLLALNRHDVALTSGAAAVAQEPNSPDAHAVLAACYAHAGLLDEALAEYRAIVELPDAPATSISDRSLTAWRAQLGVGQILILQRQFEEAREILQRALVASGGHREVAMWLDAANT